MTQTEINAFLAIVKWGSITAAAESMYITQPALSRHLNALEKELGYKLVIRSKGVRTAGLTGEGKSFIPVAEQLQRLWKEARELPSVRKDRVLNVASVGSVSTYLLPEVFMRFMEEREDVNLFFHNYHSLEAYGYAERGEIDLALISDDRFSRSVETIPLFTEPMVCLCGEEDMPETIHPSMLEPEKEIRLPWNPEYDIWHDYWFKPSERPKVFLDQMSLLEGFLALRGVWAVMPVSVGKAIGRKLGIPVKRMVEGPGPRIIYYLLGKERKPEMTEVFLKCLRTELSKWDMIRLY